MNEILTLGEMKNLKIDSLFFVILTSPLIIFYPDAWYGFSQFPFILSAFIHLLISGVIWLEQQWIKDMQHEVFMGCPT